MDEQIGHLARIHVIICFQRVPAIARAIYIFGVAPAGCTGDVAELGGQMG
jgi:hypothetical protein